MRCPACGHLNSTLATRCSACGAMLPTEAPALDGPTTLEDAGSFDEEPIREEERPGEDQHPDASQAQGSLPPFLQAIGRDDAASESNPEAGDTARRNVLFSQEPLHDAQVDATASPSADEQPQQAQGENPPTEQRPAEVAQAPEQWQRATGRAARRVVPSRKRKVSGFLQHHERALGIGLALVVLGVLGVVWAVLNVTNAPSKELIRSDVSELLPSYEYAGGAYGYDATLDLGSVTITSCDPTHVPKDMDDQSVGGTAYAVRAELSYANDNVRVLRDVGATYIRRDDGWHLAGDLIDQGASVEPCTGVDQNKVLANMSAVLDAASQAEGASLGDLYAYGDFNVLDSNFEQSSDLGAPVNDMVIHCSAQAGFCSYEGDVTAHFSFESGEWRLASAEKDAALTQPSYQSLVGTWSGSLVNSESVGARCHGAQDKPLVVNIQSVGDYAAGSGQVQGTVTVVAHYHKRVDTEANTTTGDVLLEDVAFSGSISTDYNDELGSSLVVSCTTLGSADGDLSFELGFGTDSDPSEVVARVTSTHDYEETVWLFVPHQTSARFTDTYVLYRI